MEFFVQEHESLDDFFAFQVYTWCMSNLEVSSVNGKKKHV